MDLPQSCSSVLEHSVALRSVADALGSNGTDLDQHLTNIALSLYRAGLHDPQRLADAVAFLSTSKLFIGGFF